MGGYLACIETSEEDQFILRLCQGNDAWLGGTDEENEGDWRWLTGHSCTHSLESHPSVSSPIANL